MAMTPEERERLKLTLAGMVNAAWQKFPRASAGDLVDSWRIVVGELDRKRRARRQGKRRPVQTSGASPPEAQA